MSDVNYGGDSVVKRNDLQPKESFMVRMAMKLPFIKEKKHANMLLLGISACFFAAAAYFAFFKN
jgi:hypothetical protein